MYYIEAIPNTSGMCWLVVSGAGRFVLTRYNSRNWHLHERDERGNKGALHSICGNLTRLLSEVRVHHFGRLPKHA